MRLHQNSSGKSTKIRIRICFSFTGNQGKIGISDKEPQAVVTLFLPYQEEIGQVFLFVTLSKRQDNTD